ncbi:MAG: (d)CMP kinase [Luteitalea sp.]|nr:(d)CMP kinase [Luteitalea sp.]
MIVAIDGPSGAGKGTVARAVARALGYRYIDTGAMYRAVAWLAIERGLSLTDEARVADLTERADFVVEAHKVEIDGHDVTRVIRTPRIDEAAAAVARLPTVRTALVTRQRLYGSSGHLVMEGRDIGTTVFPHADVKLYLDASPEERARRRASDPAHAGEGGDVRQVATALGARDTADRTRTASPLQKAEDAVLIDTTKMTVDAVVREVLSLVDPTCKMENAGRSG